MEKSFDILNVLLYLAIILVATKGLGIITRRFGLPQVAGMVIAGLLVGPALFSGLHGSFHGLVSPTAEELDVLNTFSQIGVVMILFSSGLETDIQELKRSGLAATLIALMGVLVPIALGFVGAMLFMQGFGDGYCREKMLNALFIGCILAATSVGITVETLRELGKLNTRVGTTVLSAAIIDDVIGIIALSLITSLNGGGNVWMTLLKAAGFFVFSIGLGMLLRWLFKRLEHRWPHTRRTGIFSLAMAFLYAYCAEKFFGIAAITGAYMAGIMLSGLDDTRFVDRRIEISAYMFFAPLFFAYIGISADFSRFRWGDLLFGLTFVALGVIGKILGCGAMARPCRYNGWESLTIGCGMIARGEVALAVYTTGQSLIYTGADGSLLGIDPLVGIILLIVITSVLCPVLLKLLFRDKAPAPTGAAG